MSNLNRVRGLLPCGREREERLGRKRQIQRKADTVVDTWLSQKSSV